VDQVGSSMWRKSRNGSAKVSPSAISSKRPLVLLTDEFPGVDKVNERNLFFWDCQPRRFLPTFFPDLTDGGDEAHAEMSFSAGHRMHFATLEFDDEKEEHDFQADAVSRRWHSVQISVFVLGALKICIWSVLLYSDLARGDSWTMSVGHLASAILFLVQYGQMKLDHVFVRRQFQQVLLFWSLFQALVHVLFVSFVIPRAFRAMPENKQFELGSTVVNYLSTQMMIGFVVYRMRFAYYVFVVACVFTATFSLSSPKVSISDLRILSVVCGSLAMMTYVHEMKSRRDFVQSLALLRESRRSDMLLNNILPGPVIHLIKSDNFEHSFAVKHENVTILFADIVSFTTISAEVSPSLLVGLLGRLFARWDDLAEQIGIEKIKTVGDSYMAAGGLPLERPDHAQATVRFGLLMLASLAGMINPATGEQIQIRVGVHTGACVAGVIGQNKFAYDIWGDAVNTASRMESHGQAMRVHCTRATYEAVKDEFCCEARGLVKIKGKGEMETFFVISETLGSRATLSHKPSSATMVSEPQSPSQKARSPMSQALLKYARNFSSCGAEGAESSGDEELDP